MLARCFSALFLTAIVGGTVAYGQSAGPTVPGNTGGWRGAAQPDSAAATQPASNATPARASTAASPAPRRPIARVTDGSGALPNNYGQVWREYDISPYTRRVTVTKRPEQAIVDWILRETGYEAWHGEPLAVLSADNRLLRVYHTPEMQSVVAEIVDRFVSSEAQSPGFALQVVSVSEPDWRTRAHRMLRPVPTHTPGVQAWLLQKEDAARVLDDLRRRSDFHDHGAPQMLVSNGQPKAVAWSRDRGYRRNVTLRGDTWPGFEVDSAKVDEGFSLEITPLLSLDGRIIDATIRCDIDQVEKMIPVTIDVPTAASPRQRTELDVPQLARTRLHERFRWPVEHVLLVDLGMVGMPSVTEEKPLVPGLTLPFGGPQRADLLVFVQPQPQSATAAPPPRVGERPTIGARTPRY